VPPVAGLIMVSVVVRDLLAAAEGAGAGR